MDEHARLQAWKLQLHRAGRRPWPAELVNDLHPSRPARDAPSSAARPAAGGPSFNATMSRPCGVAWAVAGLPSSQSRTSFGSTPAGKVSSTVC